MNAKAAIIVNDTVNSAEYAL